MSVSVDVRARREDDLDALVALADTLRAVENYPPDSPGWFDATGRLAAWVAIEAGRLVGHVALHERSAAPVMEMAVEATGLAAGQLAVVARLIVVPELRRHGLGRRLLDHAVARAHAANLQPVLDVATIFTPAIALYEGCGWTRVGDVTFPYHDAGQQYEAHSYVYVGPAPG